MGKSDASANNVGTTDGPEFTGDTLDECREKAPVANANGFTHVTCKVA